MKQPETRRKNLAQYHHKKYLLLGILFFVFIILVGIFAPGADPDNDIKPPALYPNPELKAL